MVESLRERDGRPDPDRARQRAEQTKAQAAFRRLTSDRPAAAARIGYKAERKNSAPGKFTSALNHAPPSSIPVAGARRAQIRGSHFAASDDWACAGFGPGARVA